MVLIPDVALDVLVRLFCHKPEEIVWIVCDQFNAYSSRVNYFLQICRFILSLYLRSANYPPLRNKCPIRFGGFPPTLRALHV